MQPTTPRPVTPETLEAAVVERFLATGHTAAELAQEFDAPRRSVQIWIDCAARGALGPALKPANAATAGVTAPQPGDTAPPASEPLLEAAARAVGDGGSIASVASWFAVPESGLQAWIGERSEQAPDEPVDEVHNEAPTPGPASPPPAAPSAPVTPIGPVDAAPRPSPARRTPTVYSSDGAVATRRRPSHPSPMGIRDSVQLLRRRLPIVLIALLLGAAAGWFTAPGEARRVTTYQATHTLLYDAQGGQTYNIEQIALLATSGEVPSRVAARLELERAQVRSRISAVAKAEVSTISLTARGSTAERAVSLADATAEELSAHIDGAAQANYQAELSRLNSELDAARNRLNAAKNPAAQAQARSDVAEAQKAFEQYQSKGVPKPSLRTLEEATASAAEQPGVQAPNSKPVRAALLGIVGLLAGLAGAFALDRLDSRIRTKTSAEEAFGVPVVAEVPRISKASQGQLLARTDPSSPFVEAYRGLRTYVALWAPEVDREDGHRVLVVTSPSPGEGKTTTVAHLAAMLAEIGRSVVVVSADLRRPRLHQFFNLAGGPGLVEALAVRPGPPVFTGLDQPTSVRGVRVIPSGAPLENPAPLFEHAHDLLQAVRPLADFVLIDAPPLLVANDAVEMARYADGVLMVVRAGETSIEAAERSAEILERLAIPVVGSVLVASEAASSASRYYASHYYSEPDRRGPLRRRPPTADGRGPAAQNSPAPDEAPPAVGGQ